MEGLAVFSAETAEWGSGSTLVWTANCGTGQLKFCCAKLLGEPLMSGAMGTMPFSGDSTIPTENSKDEHWALGQLLNFSVDN